MTLEKTDTIDIITKPQDGRVGLIIVDAGVTTDPEARFLRLMAKLKTYGAYVMSDDFKQRNPGIGPSDVIIRIVFNPSTPPTQQMLEIAYVRPKGQNDQIPVVFEKGPQ